MAHAKEIAQQLVSAALARSSSLLSCQPVTTSSRVQHRLSTKQCAVVQPAQLHTAAPASNLLTM